MSHRLIPRLEEGAARGESREGAVGLSGNWPPAPARRPGIASFLLMAVIGALLAIASPASATTINVNCPAQDLQVKIDAAPDGSTLLIKGTCVGNFFVDKNLTLKGLPAATLDGNDSGTTLGIPDTH